jgi:hypothetical protein
VAVEQLSQDYASQPVVFIEYDVDDDTFAAREQRWWTAHGGGSVTLPMVMVDSGHEFSNGYEDFDTRYTAMVDASLARPAAAEITASGQRVGDTLHFDIQIVNRLGATLGAGNSARVWVIVYEEFSVSGAGRLTNRFVRAIASTALSPDLPDGETRSLTLDTGALSGVAWENLRAIVLVDYRPGGTSGAYDTLQALKLDSFPTP